MNNKIGFVLAIVIVIGLVGTYFYQKSNPAKPKRVLPLFGIDSVITKNEGGKEVLDTIFHKVPDFKFVAQDGKEVTMKNLENKIFVADFFFSTCQSICVDMGKQKQRLYKAYEKNPNIIILSHTVDPEIDTPEVLLEYAKSLGVKDNSKWYFVTGDKKSIYDQARKGYMVTATQGDGGPDDFVHTERFALVDKNHHIRGYYDGTSEQEVNKLMYDIEQLQKEEK